MRHCEIRRDRVGRHAVHTNPVLSQLGGDALGEPGDGVLRRRVAMGAESALNARHARQRDYRSPAPRDHHPSGVLHSEENAVHIHIEDPLEVLQRDVSNVGDLRARDAGVIHQDVDGPVLLGGEVDGASDVILDGDVAVEEGGDLVAADGLAEDSACLVENIGDADFRPMDREQSGYAFPDAGGSPGYQRNLSFKASKIQMKTKEE
ncbi:hypothetical protein KSP40_PGU022230 [Platanthera guangdongensis]|uniref:Uncharacterized protein n=1 Tax=Platanthera guangdongensis TaxID=2320717 RepID=A0ABR2MWV1_9ASPA